MVVRSPAATSSSRKRQRHRQDHRGDRGKRTHRARVYYVPRMLALFLVTFTKVGLCTGTDGTSSARHIDSGAERDRYWRS